MTPPDAAASSFVVPSMRRVAAERALGLWALAAPFSAEREPIVTWCPACASRSVRPNPSSPVPPMTATSIGGAYLRRYPASVRPIAAADGISNLVELAVGVACVLAGGALWRDQVCGGSRPCWWSPASRRSSTPSSRPSRRPAGTRRRRPAGRRTTSPSVARARSASFIGGKQVRRSPRAAARRPPAPADRRRRRAPTRNARSRSICIARRLRRRRPAARPAAPRSSTNRLTPTITPAHPTRCPAGSGTPPRGSRPGRSRPRSPRRRRPSPSIRSRYVPAPARSSSSVSDST